MTTNFINYLVGYFLADGGFTVTLNKSKGNIDAVFRISSKNEDILSLFEKFLRETVDVNAKIDRYKSTSNRASALRVQGVLQVLKVLDFIKQNASIVTRGQTSLYLIGVKYRTFLIVEYLIKNRNTLNKNRKIQIDLIKNMHKISRKGPDLTLGGSQTISRQDLEKHFNLPKDSSINAAEDILATFDEKYNEQVFFLSKEMENKKLNVDKNLIVGLTDGDGSFSLIDRKNSREIHLDINLTNSSDSVIVNDVWSYGLLGETAKSYKVKDKNAYQTKIRNQESLKKALEFFSNNPPKAFDRKKRFELMLSIFELKQNKKFTYDRASAMISDFRDE